MGIHADIMALRDTLGISYKDASHRLYMAEWEKLKVDDAAHKAYQILNKRTHDAVVNLQKRLQGLDSQNFVAESEADV